MVPQTSMICSHRAGPKDHLGYFIYCAERNQVHASIEDEAVDIERKETRADEADQVQS